MSKNDMDKLARDTDYIQKCIEYVTNGIRPIPRVSHALSRAELDVMDWADIVQGIAYHCQRVGATFYFYHEEVRRAKADRACVEAYREHGTGRILVYTRADNA